MFENEMYVSSLYFVSWLQCVCTLDYSVLFLLISNLFLLFKRS